MARKKRRKVTKGKHRKSNSSGKIFSNLDKLGNDLDKSLGGAAESFGKFVSKK